jgi:hypothetical protein
MPIRETPTRTHARGRAVATLLRASDKVSSGGTRRTSVAASQRSSDRRASGQRGGGRISTLIWLVVMVALIYAGFKVIPVLVTEYQFQDFMQTTARFASVNRNTTAADISKSVMDEATKQAIPLQPDDIHVTAQSGDISISADYSVTVDLNVYQLTLNFHPSAGNKPLT